MIDQIKSNASFWQKLGRRFRSKEEKRKVALDNLGAAIELTRQDGRIDAIRKAWDAYMSALVPVDKAVWKRSKYPSGETL